MRIVPLFLCNSNTKGVQEQYEKRTITIQKTAIKKLLHF